MSDWKVICRVADPARSARAGARGAGGEVAVAFRNAEDEVFALLDRCPHIAGGPLSQGIVFGESVACPLHNWTIGLADGQAPRRPDVGCTTRFAVKVEGGVRRLARRRRAEPLASRRHRSAAVDDTRSTCPYCGVGCG